MENRSLDSSIPDMRLGSDGGDSIMIGVTEAVRNLVAIHRSHAAILESYESETAGLLEKVASEYERAVQDNLPEWVTLRLAKESTGLSDRSLGERCMTLEGQGAFGQIFCAQVFVGRFLAATGEVS